MSGCGAKCSDSVPITRFIARGKARNEPPKGLARAVFLDFLNSTAARLIQVSFEVEAAVVERFRSEIGEYDAIGELGKDLPSAAQHPAAFRVSRIPRSAILHVWLPLVFVRRPAA